MRPSIALARFQSKTTLILDSRTTAVSEPHCTTSISTPTNRVHVPWTPSLSRNCIYAMETFFYELVFFVNNYLLLSCFLLMPCTFPIASTSSEAVHVRNVISNRRPPKILLQISEAQPLPSKLTQLVKFSFLHDVPQRGVNNRVDQPQNGEHAANDGTKLRVSMKE